MERCGVKAVTRWYLMQFSTRKPIHFSLTLVTPGTVTDVDQSLSPDTHESVRPQTQSALLVLQAPILHEPPPSVGDTAQSSRGAARTEQEADVDLEGLLASGPPAFLRDFAQGTCQPSACT
eukprot:scaffold67710_cov20-Tisochrysis_lutea.AAC.1